MAVKRSEQFEHNENPASAGFLLSGDTTGVFAKVHCTSTPVISSVLIKITRCDGTHFPDPIFFNHVVNITLLTINKLNARPARAIFMENTMPHKTNLAAWLIAAWGQLGTTSQTVLILIASLAGRTIYKGGHCRQFVGEAIILAVVLLIITPRITSWFPNLAPNEISAILGLGGIHLLRFIVKKKTGIDLPSTGESNNG